VSEMQVDQETVAIVQPAEDECRNKGIWKTDVGMQRRMLRFNLCFNVLFRSVFSSSILSDYF